MYSTFMREKSTYGIQYCCDYVRKRNGDKNVYEFIHMMI